MAGPRALIGGPASERAPRRAAAPVPRRAGGRSSCAALALALLLLAAARTAGAQGQGIPTFPEYRADVIAGRGTSVQAGAGLVIPLGVYVRTSLDLAAGATWRDGATRASGRADVIARFLLDPFRQMPAALSLGGGMSVPYADRDHRVRPYLTAVIDLEGRRKRGLTPAVQIGLGGGVRVGVVLRASPRTWR